MAKKLMSWKTKGMNRDLSVSAFNPEFAFENRNLRLGTNDANTMMSWVNEKGTMRIPIVRGNWISGDDSTRTTVTEIIGTPIGTAVINHQLVVFTTDTLHDLDYIYVLKYADTSKTQMLCKMLFGGDNLSLGFKVDHPLETLVSYESEMVQKVYWTDGINQPRVINIEGNIRRNNNTQFDFVPTLQLQEDVTVKKILGASGTFAPGVIQYAFTYYTRYGQESNIFYTSPLLYISYRDRGASPEDKVENAFKITVTGVDANFDYLRIYSIQRTSIDATPICKRIQDISIKGLGKVSEDDDRLVASYLDTGTSGNSVDPTELLYKGGEVISAETMEQKDNTLFFGNISITRPNIPQSIKDGIKNNTRVTDSKRMINALSVSTGSYIYSNQLTSVDAINIDRSVPCAGFKYGDTYRLGVQFQYKTGQWSEPVWVADKQIGNKPALNSDNTIITLPTMTGVLAASEVSALIARGYRKVRGVVVFPRLNDRDIVCQGVVNPTLFTTAHRVDDKDLYAQASWFFRASNGRKIASDGSVSPADKETLPYTHMGIKKDVPKSDCYTYIPTDMSGGSQNPNALRLVEVEGEYDEINKFQVDRMAVTFNSPDIEFDTQLSLMDYSSSHFRQVGYAQFSGTMSDIEIQTETPTIGNGGAGFIHKSFTEHNTYGIVSGLFYDDYIVDDNDDGDVIEKYNRQQSPCKWMVFLWNKSGALNNDINRPANIGVQSAVLKRKVISNLRYANTYFNQEEAVTKDFSQFPQLFSSNENSILKLGSDIYRGNIDTSLVPDRPDGSYFAAETSSVGSLVKMNWWNQTNFLSNSWWKTFSLDPDTQDNQGLYKYQTTGWEIKTDHIGDSYLDLTVKKNPIRMKYKSTPHLVFSHPGSLDWGGDSASTYNSLPVVEITQPVTQRFGGTSSDAFKENVWLPCGDPKTLSTAGETVIFSWEYGDTYFQRWDCLKTYAFTQQDPNSVIEIGSFMLETRVNIDGRYDKNRGQMSNLNMSPQNFNLLNPIYTQQDNFFQYRIQDSTYYEDTVFPNQITWSKTKSSGADVDLWTNMTLASTLEMDGNRGKVTSLNRFNDQLICFQDSGISQVLYNENTQISTTEGVPIEIANSGKVQGKRYLTDNIGCSNKWSITSGAAGLYFMDSDAKNIHVFNGQLGNVSLSNGFNAWSKLHIPAQGIKWTPIFPETNEQSAFVSYYDKKNQEVLFINHDLCLAYSEKFGAFTSFYDYQTTPFFNNLDDTGIWLRANQLWKHHAGDYCRFFGTLRPYSMVLVGNPEPQLDKIFTNIEFRACVDGDGTASGSDFTPYLPFDSLDTWNEYQHGIAYLNNMRYPWKAQHHTSDNEASLIRKFRIWRCDIPRDNGDVVDTFDETFDDTFHPISRTSRHPLDRMRNPWLYLRLRKDEQDSNRRAEIHDIIMTYFT